MDGHREHASDFEKQIHNIEEVRVESSEKESV
jgi:hypothetical protein